MNTKYIHNCNIYISYNFYISSGYHTGERYLEVGCGSTLYPSLLASKTFTEIHLSDYNANNLAEIQAWLEGNRSQAWSVIIDDIAKAEGIR